MGEYTHRSEVRKWKGKVGYIVSPTPKAPPSNHHLAIIEPTPETSPVVCNLLLRGDKSFAYLMAADLVHWVSRGLSSTIDTAVEERLRKTTKVVYLEANLV